VKKTLTRQVLAACLLGIGEDGGKARCIEHPVRQGLETRCRILEAALDNR
jgi:hypothetical protein